VGRDAATLIDKFTLIGSYLRPSQVADDTNAFTSAKRSRDLLMHTGEGVDDTLPLEFTMKLLVDYISEFVSVFVKSKAAITLFHGFDAKL
jgi:hypothetical protein